MTPALLNMHACLYVLILTSLLFLSPPSSISFSPVLSFSPILSSSLCFSPPYLQPLSLLPSFFFLLPFPILTYHLTFLLSLLIPTKLSFHLSLLFLLPSSPISLISSYLHKFAPLNLLPILPPYRPTCVFLPLDDAYVLGPLPWRPAPPRRAH
jgi:hypothetical protein